MTREQSEHKALLDRLFAISGLEDRVPLADDYQLVSQSLHHPSAEIRERAYFIAGLRWMDRTLLDAFSGKLLANAEPVDALCGLMASCLASAGRLGKCEAPVTILEFVLANYPRHSQAAKAAHVGLRWMAGELSVQEYATLDFDQFDLNR